MIWIASDVTLTAVKACRDEPPPDLYPEERQAVAPPPDMKVSEWADDRRILQTETSRISGLWRTDLTPYLREIMDAFNKPHIRHVSVCAGTQVGKTEVINNILGYVIDLAPAPALLVYPREDDAKTISRTRLDSMLKSCPTLRAKIPVKQDLNQLLEKHFPGMVLYLVGANSAAALASKPCMVVLRDEINKYPPFVGEDADPLSLSEARTKSYWDIRKIYDVSSPTIEGVGISKQIDAMDVVYRLHVPCPFCGLMQALEFGQVKWRQADAGQDKYFLARTTAIYECSGCGTAIDDSHKQAMLAGHAWVPDRELSEEPERIGFDRLSSLYSPFLTWGAIAEEFLRKKDESDRTASYGPLQDFINGWLAEPWKNVVSGGDQRASLILVAPEHKRGNVPEAAVALTACVDVQKSDFWYSIRAWARDKSSWLVDFGKLETWEDVEGILFESSWPIVGSGQKLRIWRAGIDTGGDRTEEVYFWLRRNGGGGRGCRVLALKGSSRPLVGKIQPGAKLDRAPSGKLIPGGIQLFLTDTDKLKAEYWTRVEYAGIDQPGAFWIFEDCPPYYLTQVTAEEKIRDRHGQETWCQIGSRPNHLLDTECMNLAIADTELWGGVAVLHARMGQQAKPPPPAKPIEPGEAEGNPYVSMHDVDGDNPYLRRT